MHKNEKEKYTDISYKNNEQKQDPINDLYMISFSMSSIIMSMLEWTQGGS